MTLHPQSKAFLEALEVAGPPEWKEMPLDEARKMFDGLELFGDVTPVADVKDHEIAGVPVRMYYPRVDEETDKIGSIVFFFRYNAGVGVVALISYAVLTPILLVFVFRLWVQSPLAKRMVLGSD